MKHEHFYAGIRFIGDQAFCSVSLIGGPSDFGVLRTADSFEDALDSALIAMEAKLDGRDPAEIIAETSKRVHAMQAFTAPQPAAQSPKHDDVDDLIGGDDEDLVG